MLIELSRLDVDHYNQIVINTDEIVTITKDVKSDGYSLDTMEEATVIAMKDGNVWRVEESIRTIMARVRSGNQ